MMEEKNIYIADQKAMYDALAESVAEFNN